MLTLSQLKQAIKDTDRDTIENVLEDHGEDVLEAGIECGVNPSDIAEAYAGEYKSDADFAQEMAEQVGDFNPNMGWPHNCIDWEQAGKELMYDYCESGGHYFRNL